MAQWHVYGRLGMLIGLRDRIDSQGPGSLQVYSDPEPPSLGAGPTDPPLFTVTLPVPCADVYPAGLGATDLAVMTLIIPDAVYAFVAGQAGWGQITSNDGTAIIRGRAGLAGDTPTPNFIMNDRQVYVGGEVTVTGTFTL